MCLEGRPLLLVMEGERQGKPNIMILLSSFGYQCVRLAGKSIRNNNIVCLLGPHVLPADAQFILNY